MRHLIFVLFSLATLPAATVKATPYAEYNPATGDIRIREISGIGYMNIRSASGSLNPNVLTAPMETVPVSAARPSMRVTLPGLTISHRGLFPFTSLTIHGAFLPGTPVTDVSYFDSYRTPSARQGTVVQVPEPTSIAIAGASVAGVIAFCCRRRAPAYVAG